MTRPVIPINRACGLAILAALCVSCAPRVIPVTPIAPAAAHLQATVAATTASAKRISREATAAHADATIANATIAQSAAKADKMALAGTATKEELAANAKAWHDAWLANSRVVDSSSVLAIDSHELDQASCVAAIEAAGLVTHAEATDKATVELKEDNAKKTAAADKWNSLTWTFWIVVGLVVLGVVLWALARFTTAGASVASKFLRPW